MKRREFLIVALLSVSIMSYGFNGQAFADTHNVPPLSASAELPSYDNRDRVVINGQIKDFDSEDDSGKAITLTITSPDGNRVGFGQLTPASDGSFSYSFVAGGPLWKVNGDYIVKLNFGSMSSTVNVLFTGADTAPPPPMTCDAGQELRDGICVDIPPPPPPPMTCDAGQELRDGICVDIPPPPPPPMTCDAGQELRDGICVDIPPPTIPPTITCGAGTHLVDGSCVPIDTTSTDPSVDGDDGTSGGGSCLIATAAFGSELAPQVQFLREIRDGTLMTTSSGTAFMTGFNQVYYSFSPAIADLERENPVFRDAVRAFITPMVSTLSIMSLADSGSETDVVGLGISIIMLNLGIYIAAPALIGFTVHRHFKSR